MCEKLYSVNNKNRLERLEGVTGMGKEEALSIVFASCLICLTITFIIRIGLKRYLNPLEKYSRYNGWFRQ